MRNFSIKGFGLSTKERRIFGLGLGLGLVLFVLVHAVHTLIVGWNPNDQVEKFLSLLPKLPLSFKDPMAAVTFSLGLIVLVGFALQQAVEIADSTITAWSWRSYERFVQRNPTIPLEFGAFKKSVVARITLGLALVTVSTMGIRLLTPIMSIGLKEDQSVDSWVQLADLVVSSIILSAGTEGANIVLKYLGYVKDARSMENHANQAQDQAKAIKIVVIPAKAEINQGTTRAFVARVTGSTAGVSWDAEPRGGSIDPNSGLFTAAPSPINGIKVWATSREDPSYVAFAEVDVV